MISSARSQQFNVVTFAADETNRETFHPTTRFQQSQAGQWTNRMSRNMIMTQTVPHDRWRGIRCSLYVSGCPFHYEMPQHVNLGFPEAGHDTRASSKQIMDDLSQSYVQGITFLGEANHLLNTGVLFAPCAQNTRTVR